MKPFEKAAMAGLCVFAFGLATSISLTEIGMSAAMVCAALAAFRGEIDLRARFRELFGGEFIIQAWLFYMAVAVVSAVFAIYPARSLRFLASDFLKPVFCVFLLAALDRRMLVPVLLSFLGGVVFFSLKCSVRTAFFWLDTGKLVRAKFTGGAREIVPLAFCYAAAAALRPENGGRCWYSAAAVFLIIITAFSQTRSALMSLAGAMAVLAVCEKTSRKPLLAVVALGGVLLVAIASVSSEFSNRMRAIPHAMFTMSDPRSPVRVDQAVQNRREQWAVSAKVAHEYPVFGVGPDNMTQIFRFYHPRAIDNNLRGGWTAHNLYLNQAAERGFTGLAALLAVWGALLYCVFRLARGSGDPYSLAAAAAAAGFLMTTVTGEPLQDTQEASSLFLLIAASYARHRH
ncbi:MAG: O-antigen ligase family protein [Elusimicrobiales bacterium]